MKKLLAVILVLLCTLGVFGCSDYTVQYECDLSRFPSTEKHMSFGKVIEVAEGKLLVEPVLDQDKAEYGEYVWVVSERASFSIGQVVKYTFYDVKAPDKMGDPLNIIAYTVYME